MFLESNEKEVTLTWRTNENVDGWGTSTTTWAFHIAEVDERVKDQVINFSLKVDMIEHIWSLFGDM